MRRVGEFFRSPAFIVAFLLVTGALVLTRDQWTWVFADGDAQTVGEVAERLLPDRVGEEAHALARAAVGAHRREGLRS